MVSPLNAQGRAIVEKLGGVWTPQGGMCHCPAHDDCTPSLSVRVGDRALLFKCFAGCDTRDVLRIVRAIDRGALQSIATHSPPGSPPTSWNLRRAHNLWHSSIPLVGTIGENYLRRRGIEQIPSSIRFHPRAPLGSGRKATFRPAMIAAVRERRQIVAVHRTFFALNAPRIADDLPDSRLMLGRPRQGAVMLAPATDILGLAEGLETAISAMNLLDIPVWATLGSERLHNIALPSGVAQLILLPDNDRAGRRAVTKALAAYEHPARIIQTIWPPMGMNDWNDVHRMEGSGGGMGGERGPDGQVSLARRYIDEPASHPRSRGEPHQIAVQCPQGQRPRRRCPA
ncbi:toprim domain-containing protein [Sphingobium sp.]|uniref:DUF7146 domain-containing protein n=1 Tax=Sphingobium sp. TaxID=1912891 RepID=UPI0035C6F64A